MHIKVQGLELTEVDPEALVNWAFKTSTLDPRVRYKRGRVCGGLTANIIEKKKF